MKKSLIALALLSQSIMADTFYLNDLVTAEESSGLNQVVKNLITHKIESEGHVVVTNKDKADSIVSPVLLKLGTSYIFSLNARGEHKNNFSVKLKDLDELDVVLKRSGEALLKEKSFASTKSIGEITAKEKDYVRQKSDVDIIISYGLGPGSLIGVEDRDGSVFSTNFGYGWQFDESMDLTMNWDFTTATNTSRHYSSMFIFKGNYYLMKGNHSPYLSLDFGYGGIRDGESRISSWVYGAGFGYKMYRTSKVNFGLDVQYLQFSEVMNNKTPGALSAKFSVYF